MPLPLQFVLYAALAAAPPADPPPTQLLVVGVYHFVQNEDFLRSAEGQREIEEVVRLLAAYRPTHVAVEFTPERRARTDSLYDEYRAGRWPLGQNEVYQLGFRLARMAGHERVHLVDTERNDFFVQLYFDRLSPRATEASAVDSAGKARLRALAVNDAAGGRTLRAQLAFMNSPEELRRSHMAYHVGVFKFDGEADGYLGTDFVSGWYNRNLRIFRNLQRLTTAPGDRVLLIIGAGHVPLLRFIAQHSPEYEWVDAGAYLQAR